MCVWVGGWGGGGHWQIGGHRWSTKIFKTMGGGEKNIICDSIPTSVPTAMNIIQTKIFKSIWGGGGGILRDPTPTSVPTAMNIIQTKIGARCNFVIRVFAHGAMGRRIDPSWWTH